jgi:hypothetical protein
MRVARPPNVPGIYEDEEPLSSSDEDGLPPGVAEDREPKQHKHSPPRKLKTRPRLSVSRLPLPSRSTPLPPPPAPAPAAQPMPTTPHVDFAAGAELGGAVVRKKKPRRESGFITTTTAAATAPSQAHVGGGDVLKKDSLSVARPDSPTFDSPIKKSISLVINEDGLAGVAAAMKKEKKRSSSNSNSVPVQDEYDMAVLLKRKEKERERDKEEKRMMKLKDVTNSPRKRQALKLMSDNEGKFFFFVMLWFLRLTE